MLDDLFDYCFPILDKIGHKLDSVEDDMFERRAEDVVRDLSNVKQEIISYRKIIKPERTTLRVLERRVERFLPEELDLYFDDIVDASERIWDLLDNYKEVVEGLESTNESVISHRQNDVLRILTVFSATLLPLTLLASVFGMNVDFPGFGTRARVLGDRRGDARRRRRPARLLPLEALDLSPMDVVRAGRADGFGARRLGEQVAARSATIWRTPHQRRLLVALVSASLAALAFAHIAEDYVTNDPLARWDVQFARWLAGERSPAGTDVFSVFTFFGSPAVALAISAVVFVILYRRRLLVQAALLPLVLGGAELLNLILKLSFHRTRPDVAFVQIDSYSFPSGHAMISAAAYGALAYLAWPHLRTHRRRALLVAATALVVALIGFSRLYLGVHYLSDVLAGVAGGVFWLSLSIALHSLYGDRFAAWFAGTRADRLGRRLTRS